MIIAPTTRVGLSSGQRRLVDLMSEIRFGRIELSVAAGQPSFDPYPIVVREWLLGCVATPSAHLVADFTLKSEVIELFQILHQVGAGRLTIEVRHGLPFKVTWAERGFDERTRA